MVQALLRLFRNTLFRLSLLGAMLFVISLFISLGYVYYATVYSQLRSINQSMYSEVDEIQQSYNQKGLTYIQREIALRASAFEGRYLLETQYGLVGNLGSTKMDEEGYVPFSLIEGEPGETFIPVRLSYAIEGDSDAGDLQDRRINALSGFIVDRHGEAVAGLIVGRDVEEIMRTADSVRNAIITSALIALVLGLISSFFVSRRFTRRIDAFNRLATDVRSGQLDRRAPRNYSEDELDLLAEHLNAMLDHISRLMTAMRYAGDSIAHDLRSPLTRLRTRLESSANDLKDDKAAHILWEATQDADELLSTFDKVLRIARLEAGEQREMLQDMDPKTVLDDMVEFYEPACEDAGLDLETNIKEGNFILADRGLLSQAVSNLLENAIKYTPTGGLIRLELYRDKNKRVVIAIVDNGPGIPVAYRQRVKERFVRLDKSRTKSGSGLGLAMVDAIATLHGAEFQLVEGITSENGEGLCCKIIFPRRRHLQSQFKT